MAPRPASSRRTAAPRWRPPALAAVAPAAWRTSRRAFAGRTRQVVGQRRRVVAVRWGRRERRSERALRAQPGREALGVVPGEHLTVHVDEQLALAIVQPQQGAVGLGRQLHEELSETALLSQRVRAAEERIGDLGGRPGLHERQPLVARPRLERLEQRGQPRRSAVCAHSFQSAGNSPENGYTSCQCSWCSLASASSRQ